MSARAAWTRQDKVKAGVWAVGFAAVIMVGSWTGATLKQDKQKEEVSRLKPPLFFSPSTSLPRKDGATGVMKQMVG